MEDYRSVGGYGWCEKHDKATTFSFRSFSSAPLLCDCCNRAAVKDHIIFTEYQVVEYLTLAKSVTDVVKHLVLDKVMRFIP